MLKLAVAAGNPCHRDSFPTGWRQTKEHWWMDMHTTTWMMAAAVVVDHSWLTITSLSNRKQTDEESKPVLLNDDFLFFALEMFLWLIIWRVPGGWRYSLYHKSRIFITEIKNLIISLCRNCIFFLHCYQSSRHTNCLPNCLTIIMGFNFKDALRWKSYMYMH